jgi:hypothetical protein
MAQSFFGQNDPVVASTVPAEAVPEVVASDVEDAAPAIPTIAAAEDRRIRRKFDVESALKSGRSFTEIADELAALNNFDAEEARKSTIDPATGKKIPGYSDEEIISKLVDIRNISNVQAFGEGTRTGIAEATGMLIGGKLAFDASLPISAGVGALFPPAAPFYRSCNNRSDYYFGRINRQFSGRRAWIAIFWPRKAASICRKGSRENFWCGDCSASYSFFICVERRKNFSYGTRFVY